MQNDDSPSAQGKKNLDGFKRYLVIGILFFAELVVMYIIQNVHGCESAKTAFVGIVILAISLALFFTAVNFCARKNKK